jgi:hypothetical protein
VRAADWRRIEDRIFTPDRVELYAAGLIGCYAVFVIVGFFRRAWLVDDQGTGIALDFVAMWAAGRMALEGRAAEAYNLVSFTREQLTAVAAFDGAYTWAYPPTYFLLVAPLGLLSYATAALVWISATLAGYLAAIYAILPRRATLVAAAASPFVLWAALEGQNGLMTAALIAGVLVCIDRRPALAGIFLGLLTLKPHLGIVFPVILILGGRWRVLAAAAVTTALLVLASCLAFGVASWIAFFHAFQEQGREVLGEGAVTFWKQQSVHALVRLLGGGDGLAWSLHIAAALAATMFTAWLWLRPTDTRLKAASLALAALIATPYLFTYDLPILTVPVAFLVSAGMANGFITGERTVLALLMLVLALIPGRPVGMPLFALVMLLIVLRIRATPAPAAVQSGISGSR